MKRYIHLLPLILLFFISLFHLILFYQYSPTWDFPHNWLIGMIRLGKMPIPPDIHSVPYGVVSDVLPVALAYLLPFSWQPSSFLILGILTGTLGVIFFYLMLKETYGTKTAFLSALTIFLLPRFVGHLHTNLKDIGSSAFFLITLYFISRNFKRFNFKDSLFSIIAFSLAVNTKLTVIQSAPVFLFWIIYKFWRLKKTHNLTLKIVFKYGFYIFLLFYIPILCWFLLWPHGQFPFFTTLIYLQSLLSTLPSTPWYYSIQQILITTPLPLLFFTPVGLYLLLIKFIKERNELSGIFFLLFFYSLLKYPLLHLQITDDIRYFIEIYYPLSLASVLGVNVLFKKYADFIFIAVFIFLVILIYRYHPYEINYYNFLSSKENRDEDFWASSYQEVFNYINKEVPPDSTVSARLAPELAAYLIRSDLKRNLNSRSPEESNFTVILNRPSFFHLFQVEDFFLNHRPYKLFTDKNGNILAYFYKLN